MKTAPLAMLRPPARRAALAALLLTAAFVALAAPGPASAQTAPPGPGTEAAQPAPPATGAASGTYTAAAQAQVNRAGDAPEVGTGSDIAAPGAASDPAAPEPDGNRSRDQTAVSEDNPSAPPDNQASDGQGTETADNPATPDIAPHSRAGDAQGAETADPSSTQQPAPAPEARLLSEGAALVFADRAPWTPPEGGYVWATERPREGVQARSQIVLTAYTDSDGGPMLLLSERRDEGERTLTRFPVSAGDPVVVYFLETVARDMAMLTGGSPFYIRNRMKEAIARGGEVSRGEGIAVVLRPFADDPNEGRMFGFDKLTVSFDLGPDPAAPIPHLRAEAPAEDGGPGYLLDMRLESTP